MATAETAANRILYPASVPARDSERLLTQAQRNRAALQGMLDTCSDSARDAIIDALARIRADIFEHEQRLARLRGSEPAPGRAVPSPFRLADVEPVQSYESTPEQQPPAVPVRGGVIDWATPPPLQIGQAERYARELAELDRRLALPPAAIEAIAAKGRYKANQLVGFWTRRRGQLLAQQAGEPRTVAPVETQTTPAESGPVAVVSPTVALVFLKKAPAVGRVYELLRVHDNNGSGQVSREDARELLTGDGSPWRCMSGRRLRQILNQGNGRAWHISAAGDIYLYSPARVAIAYEAGPLARKRVAVPVDDLLGTIQQVKAALFGVWYTSRPKRAVMSQQTIEALTGVKVRNQYTYNQILAQRARVRVIPNVAITEHRWDDLQARERIKKQHKHVFPQRSGGKVVISYARPNSYESQYTPARFGRVGKHNKRIAASTKNLVTSGGRVPFGKEAGRIVRVNHDTETKAASAFTRNSDISHYYPGSWTLQPTARRRSRLRGVQQWPVFSLEGVAA